MGSIVTKEEFPDIKKKLKEENKKIILCHGVFDLVHPGHLIHFKEAKELGDTLIISITSEKYVRKGPGRPYFNDELRLQFLSALDCVDYVMLSESYTVNDIIETVEPSLYVKGNEYKNAQDDITGKIQDEVDLVRKHGGEVYFTSGQVFSSTKLINNALPSLTNEMKVYMRKFKKDFCMKDITNYVDKMQDLRILVVGDIIIDEYNFCTVQGLMSKDMGYSTRFEEKEKYLGGSLAVARHISSFCNNVTLCSVLGNEKNIHSRLLNELSSKMRLDLECSSSYETIVKQRFVVRNEKRQELNKLFAINNLSKNMEIDKKVMGVFKQKLRENIEQFDMVVLCDFGHGLIDEETKDIIQENSRLLSINCQTNSSNYGFNLITKYKRADAFALDQKELRLAYANYEKKEEDSLLLLSKRLGCAGWLTIGSKGVCSVKEETIDKCPAFTLHVTDTIGAGDALFSLVSLCRAVDTPVEIGTFLGNIAGALATNIVGNKEGIDKINILKYASTLLNI